MAISEIRNDRRAARRSLAEQQRSRKSLDVAGYLAGYLPFRRARRVAVYASLPEEVDTGRIIDLAAGLGKEVFLPVIISAGWRRGAMMFHRFIPGETATRRNRFGIPEPVHRPGDCVPGPGLDLVCVPVVAFNARCDRIGMGAGCYDRTFSKKSFRKHHLVGLAFACQQAEFSPRRHDVPMQAVITEKGILKPCRQAILPHPG